jgi:hypothetical protein
MGVRKLGLASLVLLLAALGAAGREKDKLSYGEGLMVSVPLGASEVEQIVEDVVQNGVIRGTKEYNKDEFVSGAKAATSSRVFPAWTEGGKVFYKVREHAIDPRNFKDGGDVGTLVVRYVVQPQGEKTTVLRINALFEEDFRRVVHPSDGSVESSEYKDIREHVEALELMKKENVVAERERQEQAGKKQSLPTVADESVGGAFPTTLPRSPAPQPGAVPSAPPPAVSPQTVSPQTVLPQPVTPQAGPPQPVSQAVPQVAESGENPAARASANPSPEQGLSSQALAGPALEEHVKQLRQQLERLVKAPGAPLKSAPFHTASTMQSLTPGTEVLILISTPYWYGVETHEGQHGWIMRDQLEQP